MDPIFLAYLDPPGMESSSSGEAELARLLSHPAAIAMVLSPLLVAFFPPLKLLRDRLSQRFRPKLSRYKTPLLVQFLIFFSQLAFLILFSVVESFFLDGSTARFAGLLAVETVVCSALWVLLRAMLQVFYPTEETDPAKEPEDSEDWDNSDDP
ncbi:MAG: hypothetical protein MSB10_09205 [Clostridiales bacterium]|uniref:hypothetical protein n=1 Tax=Flavonifractor porci TaxID=3133422 RepID=UPI0030A48AD1|nr:hypothetical protein [Clostridiales bacterium]